MIGAKGAEAMGPIVIRAGEPGDIPYLAESFMRSSRGVIEWLYQGAIPGRTTGIIVEHLFTRFGTAMSFSNCWVAMEGPRPIGAVHAAPSDLLIGGPADLLVPEERRWANAPFGRLRTPGAFHVISLCVDEESHRRGIGRLLMAEVEARASQVGLGLATLNVAEENSGAVRFYEHLGYREMTRQRVSVPRVLEGDVIHMSRALSDRSPPRAH
jgi:ribosomal protein S18 acetylase RimI-like enzyme